MFGFVYVGDVFKGYVDIGFDIDFGFGFVDGYYFVDVLFFCEFVDEKGL